MQSGWTLLARKAILPYHQLKTLSGISLRPRRIVPDVSACLCQQPVFQLTTSLFNPHIRRRTAATISQRPSSTHWLLTRMENSQATLGIENLVQCVQRCHKANWLPVKARYESRGLQKCNLIQSPGLAALAGACNHMCISKGLEKCHMLGTALTRCSHGNGSAIIGQCYVGTRSGRMPHWTVQYGSIWQPLVWRCRWEQDAQLFFDRVASFLLQPAADLRFS